MDGTRERLLAAAKDEFLKYAAPLCGESLPWPA